MVRFNKDIHMNNMLKEKYIYWKTYQTRMKFHKIFILLL
jgi:hypothetical protein